MTTVKTLLERLAAHRITVSVHGERLRLVGPRGLISTEMRAQVARHKGALLEALKADSERSEGISVTSKSPQTVFCDLPPGRPSSQSLPESRPAEPGTRDRFSVISVTSFTREAVSRAPSRAPVGDPRDGLGRRAHLALGTVTSQMIPVAALLGTGELSHTCYACRQDRWWVHQLNARRICRVCHPPPNPEAEA